MHWDCIDHGDFSIVIFKHEYHIKILQMKLDTFKVNQFNVFEGNDKRRLEEKEKQFLESC
jgi:hypothetical protein